MLAIQVILYAIATMVTLRFVSPWLTAGKTAFAPRENKTLVMRLLAVAGISAVYMVMNIAMAFGSPFLAMGVMQVISDPMTGQLVYALAFTTVDIILLGASVWLTSKVMRKTLAVQSFGSTVSTAVSIYVLATILQIVLMVVAINVLQ